MGIMEEFCATLKKGRKEFCMTQREAGEFAQITTRHFCEYEHGEHQPALERAQALLNAVGYELKIVKMN